MDFTYLSTPRSDLYSLARVGGCKAISSGLLILGNGADEILEYYEAPEEVAVAWRDALHALLRGYRPGRHLQQLDWLELAARVNPAWAAEQGWEAPAGASEASAPMPQRRTAALDAK